MRRQNWTFAALSLAVLAIAGCGGGGDEESTSSTPTATIPTTTALSKEELIARGDAICAEVNAAIGSLASSETDAEGQTIQVANLYIGMVQSLDGLGTPSDATGFSEFSSAADELSAAESDVKLAVEREDSAAIGEAATKATPALENFQAAAETYGFEDCSQGPSTPTAPAEPGSESAPSVEEESPVETPEAEEEAPVEEAPEPAPETGGAGSTGGGTAGGGETGGGTGGGSSGGVGPG